MPSLPRSQRWSAPGSPSADTRRLSATFTGLVLGVAGYTAAQALPALV